MLFISGPSAVVGAIVLRHRGVATLCRGSRDAHRDRRWLRIPRAPAHRRLARRGPRGHDPESGMLPGPPAGVQARSRRPRLGSTERSTIEFVAALAASTRSSTWPAYPSAAGRGRRAASVSILQSRLEATGAIVDAIGRLPAADRPTVLVNASGIAIYARSARRRVTEDSPSGDHSSPASWSPGSRRRRPPTALGRRRRPGPDGPHRSPRKRRRGG